MDVLPLGMFAEGVADALLGHHAAGRLAELCQQVAGLAMWGSWKVYAVSAMGQAEHVTVDGRTRRGEWMGTAVRDCRVTCRVRVCRNGARVPHGGRLCRGQLLSKGGEPPLHAHPTCHRQHELQCGSAALAVARSLAPAVLGALHESVACYPWDPQPGPEAVSTAAICDVPPHRHPVSKSLHGRNVTHEQSQLERSVPLCLPCFACPAREPGTIGGQNSQEHNNGGHDPCELI